MADDKIRISWEEVQNAQVDAKLAQQAALNRAQQHVYAQTSAAVPTAFPSSAPTFGSIPGVATTRSRLRYNTLFYMAVFGLIGGVAAWGFSEIAWQRRDNNPLMEYIHIVEMVQAKELQHRRGEISEEQSEKALDALHHAFEENPYVKINFDQSLAPEAKERSHEALAARDRPKVMILQVVWYILVAVILATVLSAGEPAVGHNLRGATINASVGAVAGLVGGIGMSLVIDRLYAALGGGEDVEFTLKQVFARAIGWAVLGLFLAVAPGLVLRSWKRFGIGLAGGFIGGLTGGLLFDAIANLTTSGSLSRFMGIVAIGVAAGIGTGIIENVTKSGWLRVTGGLIVGKQFVLYKNPTYIGSSPQCEIYLFKDSQIAPRHAAIHTVSGGFDLEDLHSASGTFVNGRLISRVRLRSNDAVQISSTAFSFQEKARTNA